MVFQLKAIPMSLVIRHVNKISHFGGNICYIEQVAYIEKYSIHTSRHFFFKLGESFCFYLAPVFVAMKEMVVGLEGLPEEEYSWSISLLISSPKSGSLGDSRDS